HAAGAARTIAKLGRDGELALAADLHALHTLVPTADHLAATQCEFERLVTVLARVELGAIGQPAGVMHGHRMAGSSHGTIALKQFLDLQLGLVLRQQFDPEPPRGVRRNHTARTARAIAQFGRNGELALAADLHALHTLVPATDHLAAAEAELERLVAVLARIELGAVGQPTG